MTFCDREQEVFEAVRAGRWPEQCEESLRAHAISCPVCGDLVDVASTMLTENSTARTAHVPSSGVMWWKAQRRARAEAARATVRALSIVQGVTVLIGAFIAFSLLGITSTPAEWGAFAKQLLASVPTLGLPLVLLLVAWLALAPVALYFAVSRD